MRGRWLTANPSASGASVQGLAPGAVLPGDSNLGLYGSGFDAGTSVSLAGPVYALSDTTFSSPLCTLSGGTCPEAALAASAGTSSLAFALPSSASTGYYWTRSKSSGGTYSSNGAWLKIEEAQKTYPVVPPAQHGSAPRIYSGQTVTGTFAAGGDTTNTFADYNTYYFFATAGSAINVSLQRVDTSKTWEDPSSLDPQLEIVEPDGVVYANLRKLDDQPGVDYNASLTGAVLPKTGMYLLSAETTKGSGDYTLTFSFGSVAPAPPGSRAIPFSGNYATAALGGTVAPVAFFLDPRGYTVSGASVTFSPVSSTEDHGAVQLLTSNPTFTVPDGYAAVSARLTAAGRVRLTPSLDSPALAQLVLVRNLAVEAPESEPARYAPVATLPFAPSGIDAEGRALFTTGPHESMGSGLDF